MPSMLAGGAGLVRCIRYTTILRAPQLKGEDLLAIAIASYLPDTRLRYSCKMLIKETHYDVATKADGKEGTMSKSRAGRRDTNRK